MRLASADLFGDGDSVGVRYLDSALNPLTFTRFDAVGAGLDANVGIVFDAGDFLAGVLGPGDAGAVPQTGFVEIVGLAGSFDVNAIDLFAIEDNGGADLIRQIGVTEFEAVVAPPSAVPSPVALPLLLSALMGLAGLRARRRRRVAVSRGGSERTRLRKPHHATAAS